MRALPAADVVARLKSGGGEQSPYCEEVVRWVTQSRSTGRCACQHRSAWLLVSVVRIRSSLNSGQRMERAGGVAGDNL